MKRALRVIGSRFGASKFDSIDTVKVADLVALRLQPDIFDSRNFRGHGFDACQRLLLVILRRGVLPLVNHHVDYALRLAKLVLCRNTLRVPIPGCHATCKDTHCGCNLGQMLSQKSHESPSSIYTPQFMYSH